jgi:hypothetical protein
LYSLIEWYDKSLEFSHSIYIHMYINTHIYISANETCVLTTNGKMILHLLGKIYMKPPSTG